MIITYMRSSSYGTWDFCQMQYFIGYVLGQQEDSNKAAEKGTIVHKVLEVLGNCRKDQIDRELDSKDVPELYTDEFVDTQIKHWYEYYTDKSVHKEKFKNADWNDCFKWTHMALDYNGGQFDPRKRDIFGVEVKFDIAIEEPWGAFEYDLPDGTTIQGQLAIKGTVDLVTRDNGGLEVIDWKGLPLHTLIPTPNGFVTIGNINKGDVVFDQFGSQCKVVGKSNVKIKDCYKITFDDTTSVICDDEHLWKLSNEQTIPINELSIGDKINVCKPIQCETKTLPIDPYVLGIWLGDGRNRAFEITSEDEFVFQEIEKRGYKLGKDTEKRSHKIQTRTVLKSTYALKKLNLCHNKHIPDCYFRASYSQRLDLLRGLMDSDGNVNKVRKQAVFTSCNKILSDDVKHLLITLGQRPNQGYVKRNTNFKDNVEIYPLHFRCVGELNPFLLPRKANSIDKSWGEGRSFVRRIVKIEKSETQKTQCIAVDSEDNTYLCTENFIPTHNTGQRKNWATGEEYTYSKLMNNPQLLLYYYALTKTYPEFADDLIMTIFYIKAGGPFSLCFGELDKVKFLEMLRLRVQEIQKCVRPKMLSPKQTHFKCTRMCHFYKNKYRPEDKDNMCMTTKKMINKHGIDVTVAQLTAEGHSIDYYHDPGS